MMTGIDRWRRRRQVHLAADRFPLPPHLTLDEIVEQAEQLTGRPTAVVKVAMDPHSPSGRVDRMRIDGQQLDLVQVPEDTDPDHQEFIALHEIAHLVLRHIMVPAEGIDLTALPLLARIYGADAIQAAYQVEGSFLRGGCEACDAQQEQDAERFARRLAARVQLARRPHAVAGSAEAAQQLAERVDRTFGVE